MRAVILLILLAGAAHAEDDPAEAPIAAPIGAPADAGGPPVGEVLSAAYAAAGLDRAPSRGWVRRARLGGLVPLVSVRAGRNARWQDIDPDVGRGATVEVRATWRLDRLVFDGRELQVASIEAARRRERRALSGRVIRLYFAWRRGPRAEEAAAELDALTDGWFSEHLAGHAAPRPKPGHIRK